MIKPILLIAFVTGLLAACSPADKASEKPRLKYFEISYHSGWAERFSVKTDSAGRYLFQQRPDSFYVGVLPDTVQHTLSGILLRIKQDSL